MKTLIVSKRAMLAVSTLGVLMTLGGAAGASALANTTTSGDSAKVTAMINAGNKEIDRRLTSLNGLTTKITSATHLTASDKTALTNEVTSEISGLNALKTKLDAETTLAAVRTDRQGIVDDYRVYALIVPKVQLIRTADDQQVVQGKLTALAAKLQTRITNAKNAGKDVTALQSQLDQLNSQIQAAQAISASVETKVLALQPTDYNSDHTVLSGYRDQLKTAHSDNQTAYASAKSIVNGLKAL